MPGTEITDEDRMRIDKKFICTICHLLLSVPMQTHCGHLMCLSCIQALLEYVDILLLLVCLTVLSFANNMLNCATHALLYAAA